MRKARHHAPQGCHFFAVHQLFPGVLQLINFCIQVDPAPAQQLQQQPAQGRYHHKHRTIGPFRLSHANLRCGFDRRVTLRHADTSPHITHPVALLGMAGHAGALHQQRCHVAQLRSRLALRHRDDLLAAALESLQGEALPVIGRVLRANGPQAGEAKDGTRVGLGHLRNQPGHVGGVDQSQRLPVGGGDVASCNIKKRVGLGVRSHRDINTPVTGVPASGQHHHAEHVAGALSGNPNALCTDVGNVGRQHDPDCHAPQSEQHNPPPTLQDERRHGLCRVTTFQTSILRHIDRFTSGSAWRNPGKPLPTTSKRPGFAVCQVAPFNSTNRPCRFRFVDLHQPTAVASEMQLDLPAWGGRSGTQGIIRPTWHLSLYLTPSWHLGTSRSSTTLIFLWKPPNAWA